MTPSYTFTGLIRALSASPLGSRTIAVFMGSVLLTALKGPDLACYLLHYHTSTDYVTVLLWKTKLGLVKEQKLIFREEKAEVWEPHTQLPACDEWLLVSFLILCFGSCVFSLSQLMPCPRRKTVLTATFECLWKCFSSLDLSGMASGQRPLKESLCLCPLPQLAHCLSTHGKEPVNQDTGCC